MALPLKKRKISHATAASNAAELAQLKKVVYRRNFGEVKHLTGHLASTQVTNGNANVQILTGIATGPNQGQRIGNEIRVRDITVTGHSGNSNVDCYLVQSRTGVAPAIANFTPTIGGILTQGTSQEHFRIIKYFNSEMSGTSKFSLRHKFSIPMKVSYTGPTAAELSTNHLYVVIINRSGSNQNVQYSTELKYID